MPELPEVETVRAQLHARLAGKKIARVQIWRSGREHPVNEAFVQEIQGKIIQVIERRAKLLVWRFLDGSALTAHLKMTGRFLFTDQTYEQQKHDRIDFRFASGERVVWSDIRQFGFVRLVSARELGDILSTYGPEPLDASVQSLATLFHGSSSRSIKAFLLDQTKIAGIGNIYADEACHLAGIRPTRTIGSLASGERLKLASSIQAVLRASLVQKGTSANDYVDTEGERGGFLELLRVYGRKGEPCVTCGAPIERIVFAQRGTHFCPDCQK